MRVTMTLSLPRQPPSVTRARHVLTTLLSLTDADQDPCGHLAVLISEARANAVVHAEHDSAVEVTIIIDDHDCVIEVGNRGSTPDDGGLTAELPRSYAWRCFVMRSSTWPGCPLTKAAVSASAAIRGSPRPPTVSGSVSEPVTTNPLRLSAPSKLIDPTTGPCT